MHVPLKHLKTSDIARALGVHANTVRLYEAEGFLPEIPRGQNGYRQFTHMHLE
jgi:DNA-binding transcriptional MerR regulator